MLREQLRIPALMQVLSLYLILFAMFVMLYSISRSEPSRVRSVTGSLTTAFRSAGVMTREAEVLVSLSGSMLSRGAMQRKFGQLIASAIPVSRVMVLRPGHLMHVRMPVAALFESGSEEILPERRNLIGEIAEYLGDPPAGMRFDLEAIVGDTNFLSRESEDRRVPLSMARAASLARSLTAQGAPSGSTAAAVERGNRGWVRMIFRIESAGAPRGAPPPIERGTK